MDWTGEALDIPGAANVRDLGGHPAAGGARIAHGRVYRGDALSQLTAEGTARLSDLGLYGLVDYRLPDDRARRPDRLLPRHDIRVIDSGFLPRGGEEMLRAVAQGEIGAAEVMAEMERHYRLFATEELGRYAATFRLLLEAEGRPILVHCTSGKDRTGWAAVLIMRALGCPDVAIVADYMRTDRHRRDLRHIFDAPIAPAVLEALMRPRPRYLRAGLEALGPGTGWIDTVGLTVADLADLRAHLLEPAA